MADLVLRRARIEDAPDPVDLVVDAGVITGIGDAAGKRGTTEIDCAGRVVIPGLVESHLHPDKALLDTVRTDPTGTLAGAIAVTQQLKKDFRYEDVRARSVRVIESAVLAGTTVIRAHPDVDPVAGLLGVEVLLELRDTYRDLVDLQVVAFPQEGILKAPGTERLLRDALRAGADVIGGCAYNEATEQDCRRHVELVLDLAVEYGVPADLHADFADDTSDPRYALAEFIAEAVTRRGLRGRVALGHVTSLAGRPPAERARVAEALAAAGVAVVPLPATDLHLGGRHDDRTVRRGVAPVRELWEAGVTTACSSNNIRNAFTPYGTGDLLEIALLLAQTGHLSGPADLARVLRMVTHDAARVVGIADRYGVRVGAAADLVVLDTTRYDDILLDRPDRTHVVKAGRIVARTTRTRELLGAPSSTGRTTAPHSG